MAPASPAASYYNVYQLKYFDVILSGEKHPLDVRAPLLFFLAGEPSRQGAQHIRASIKARENSRTTTPPHDARCDGQIENMPVFFDIDAHAVVLVLDRACLSHSTIRSDVHAPTRRPVHAIDHANSV